MKNTYIKCLLLLTSFCHYWLPVLSQKNEQDRIYLVFFYVKPMSALHHEYIKAEREVFLPGHQADVNAGNKISSSVFWVESSSDYSRDYDFVVVNAYRSIDDFDAITPDSFLVNLPSGEKYDSLRMAGFKTRESPRREIWVVDTQFANALTGKFDAAKLIMNFTNSSINGNVLYSTLVKDNVIKNWESYSLFLPQGNNYPYHYLSICSFDKYNALPKLLEKTKPTSLQSSIIKQELWARWVGTVSK